MGRVAKLVALTRRKVLCVAGISAEFRADSSLLTLIRLPTGDMGGCSRGSSPPRILGFRSRFARGLLVLLVLTGVGGATGVFTFGAFVNFLVAGFSAGGKGDGDIGGLLLRAFFAFLLRCFSSSSDEPTSLSLNTLPSTLMVFESMVSTEAALKDGARFKALLRAAGAANESARFILCTLGFRGYDEYASDEELDIDEKERRASGEVGEMEDKVLSVVELGVEGLSTGEYAGRFLLVVGEVGRE